jgi:hypothetical protein
MDRLSESGRASTGLLITPRRSSGGAHSFDEERLSNGGGAMGFVGMQGGQQNSMSHSHRYLLSQSRRNLNGSNDQLATSSRLTVDPTAALDPERATIGSPTAFVGMYPHPPSLAQSGRQHLSQSRRNYSNDQFSASHRLTVDPTESLEEERLSIGSPTPRAGARGALHSGSGCLLSQSRRDLSNDHFAASSKFATSSRQVCVDRSSVDDDRANVGSPTAFKNQPAWLSQSGRLGRSGKRMHAYPGSPESGVTGASEGWEDAPGESEGPYVQENAMLSGRRESMASMRMDNYGRRSSFASVGVSSDAAAVFVPDSLPYLSLTAQLGGSYKALPAAPEPIVAEAPVVVEEAPVEQEMNKQKAPKGVVSSLIVRVQI